MTVTGTASTARSNTSRACTACSVCRPPRRKAACTRRRPQWPCCRGRGFRRGDKRRRDKNGTPPLGGAGGQNVNKVESGVRLRYNVAQPQHGRHRGILIECTETRDQPKNKERAHQPPAHFHLRQGAPENLDDIASRRKTMVSTGDRSAKDTHLQLSAGPHHRPPHQLHHLQPASLCRRRHPGLHRQAHRGRERREAGALRSCNGDKRNRRTRPCVPTLTKKT